MIDQATVNRIIDSAEIVGVVSDFVTLHRRGQNFLGLCPFHEDSRPSFTVSPAKNICKCFACGEGGTPLNFLMKHEHMSYVEALRYLAKKYGIPIVEKEVTKEEIERKNNREKLLNANAFARDAFAECLNSSSEGRMIGLSYFKERGFTPETIKAFDLGYSPSSRDFLSNKAKEAGVDRSLLEALGLAIKQDDGKYLDRFRDRVIFPIHSLSGSIVGFGGRILKSSDKLAKYINSPDSDIYNKRKELYGLYFAKQHISKQDKCLIVEGYTDVLSFHQSEIRNAVASSGTALTIEQVRLIKRFTSNVTLIFDSDAAGIKAAMRGIDILLAQDMNIKVVLLPDGHDPDSFAKAHSPEAIKEYIDEHEEDFIRFKINLLSKDGASDPHAKAMLITNIVESVAFISDDLTREVYARDSAALLDVSEEVIFSKVSSIRKERAAQEQRERERERNREQIAEHVTETDPDPADFEPMDEDTSVRVDTPITPPESISQDEANTDFPSETELSLLSHIIRYGDMIISEEDADEQWTVTEIIGEQVSDLREEGHLSSVFTRIMDECIGGIQEAKGEGIPAFNPTKHLSYHPDDTIREIANKYITEEYQLSSLHKEYEAEKKSGEAIMRLIMTDILTLKYKIIEGEILKELNIIKALSAQSETGEISSHVTRMQELNGIKRQIAELLGDRVLMLISK
ncbi:DNA primase [Porphyromonas cangingivalis]|uniref:DNA primase n=2 Tax=Porphyromonas cangingivalis TaxID=36874 RepID=A0A1T4NF02_PORCN|nr:DNA primase [Porphyromonas cangingivalis]SJZ77705.1 DNA primase [Porphyromonas cangingivalis]VEJ02294.1 DNA primase [Porphyromonas cangingivalis]